MSCGCTAQRVAPWPRVPEREWRSCPKWSLIETPESFTLLPRRGTTRTALIVERPSGRLYSEHAEEVNGRDATRMRVCYGVIGVIRLLSGPYLIVITSRLLVAEICGHCIYKITGTMSLPIENVWTDGKAREGNWADASAQELRDEADYLKMIRLCCHDDALYFSYTYDITQSLQRNLRASECMYEADNSMLDLLSLLRGQKVTVKSRHRLRPDPRDEVNDQFLWNGYVSEPLRLSSDKGVANFSLRVICGSVHGKGRLRSLLRNPDGTLCNFKARTEFCLIGRRLAFRYGPRFLRRGADEFGHAANHVESEQIISVERKLDSDESFTLAEACSFVQVRASVPVLWTQMPDGSRNPMLKVAVGEKIHSLRYRLHMSALVDYYAPPVVAISLLDQEGNSEAPLHEAFVEENLALTDADGMRLPCHLIPFDFHTECGWTEFENIGRIIDTWNSLKSKIECSESDSDSSQSSYSPSEGSQTSTNSEDASDVVGDPRTYLHCHFSREGGQGRCQNLSSIRIQREQRGVWRVNCKDCIDRTNVVLTYLGKRAASRFLSSIGVGVDLDGDSELASIIKQAWLDHGDFISRQYTGTDAMKRDCAEHGQRTFSGLLKDGLTALTRWHNNNNFDAQKMDALTLWSGDFRPERRKPSPFLRRSSSSFFGTSHRLPNLVASEDLGVWRMSDELMGAQKTNKVLPIT